ncbi:MAG: YifB family Mg chelatase-like AAA ATPase [Planctomycetes bacterium]|nr:YifB family Mg chelatase-like AAA ATPase [Planctomycetota bacterium]MBT5101383.1 YifB family Mg chelatase-like AAA ATPase [Planctomycetota bacterium]MBT7011587.1 YifB family Mg chelatase-like AAA ATPase [Planctomycetota bacterium]MBT7319374.1 YifB family Mg chelatase-like AAA ATPase [Planctomycetota bacterium]
MKWISSPILGACLHGGRAHLVAVETLLGRGLSRTIVVGMADAATRESRERLPAAMASCGFAFPRGKILFNLSPAQLPKGGLPLDLALAVGVMMEQGQVPRPKRPILFLAELNLEGRLLRPARGLLLAALEASQAHGSTLITASSAAREASMAPGIQVIGFDDLGQVASYLQSGATPDLAVLPLDDSQQDPGAPALPLRLDDVRGQESARRALVVAAAGRHSLLLQGPPGTGKSMLARRLPTLLPPLDADQALELAKIEALLGPLGRLPSTPPFRAPHATSSAQSVLGGGRPLRPGEISRAHGGVLFLDELPEFGRPVLESLRQPLEERFISIQRAQEEARFPADALLLATRNPCPCGFHTHPRVPCRCSDTKLRAYWGRTSGPLLDRFDLFVEMGPVSPERLQQPASAPHDEKIHAELQVAREVQAARQQQGHYKVSSEANFEQLKETGLESKAQAALQLAAERMELSGRGLLRTLRVARTLADLSGLTTISRAEVLQALEWRQPILDLVAATTASPTQRPTVPRPKQRSMPAPSYLPIRES